MRERKERLPLWSARSTICWRGCSWTEYVYKILPYPVNLKQEGEKARSAPTSSVELEEATPWQRARHLSYRERPSAQERNTLTITPETTHVSSHAEFHAASTSTAFGPSRLRIASSMRAPPFMCNNEGYVSEELAGWRSAQKHSGST
jgi:hypothetical protein